MCVDVYVCVCERERERESDLAVQTGDKKTKSYVYILAVQCTTGCVSFCWEGESTVLYHSKVV
jgi:hypothetical protein